MSCPKPKPETDALSEIAPPLQSSPDLGLLSARSLPADTEAVRAFARRHYGIDTVLRRLATEADDTFIVESPTATRFILKIAHAAETPQDLDLQIAVLAHLAEHAPELPVPRVLHNRMGDPLPVFMAQDGPRRARLLSYLEGVPLDTVPPHLPVQREVGRMLARLTTALAPFRHPAAERSLAWDTRRLPRLGALLDHVPDPGFARALARGLERFAALGDRIDALPRQVVHSDFNRSNLLLDPSGQMRISGIIDFGDVLRTAVAVDLATAMENQLPRSEAETAASEMLAGARAVLAGYREAAPLSEAEISLLPELMMGRVVLRGLITGWRAARFPENRAYILRNTAQGRAQLEWFLSQPGGALLGQLF